MSNYHEIQGFVADYYLDFIEAQAYLKTLGYELDLSEEANMRVLMNNFIYSADEQAIERLERYLYLEVERTKPLDDRKRLVASFFIGFGKMSASKIKEIVYQFTNALPIVTFKDSNIMVEIERGTTPTLYLVDVATVLSRRLPAHLGFVLSVKITANIEITDKSTIHPFEYALCNQLICGTYPRYAYLGQIDNNQVHVWSSAEVAPFEYRLTGTYPFKAFKGDIDDYNVEATAFGEDYVFGFPLAGTRPIQSTLGDIDIVPTDAMEDKKFITFAYVPCGTRRCGQ